MESIASIQGLATGVDFRDLVDQIIKAESRPVLVMQDRKLSLGRKEAAWVDFERRIRTLDGLTDQLARGVTFDSYTVSLSGDSTAFSASATSGAAPGSFVVDVLQTATREKVGSDVFESRDAALGLSGEFVIGGRAVAIAATDSLQEVVSSINAVNAGASRSGVAASVVGSDSTGYHIVLTASDPGAHGIRMSDGADGALRALGFLDGATSIRHQTSDGAKSDAFSSSGVAVGSLLGMISPPPEASVGIGVLSVTIDLASASLDDIANAINASAGMAGSPIEAQVVQETGADGRSVRRLDISGTTSFVDANGILETLGVLEAGRSAIAHQVRGAALTDGGGSTVATAGTLLTNLWRGGGSANVLAGDTLTVAGMRADGTTFGQVFEVTPGSTYQDLIEALNDPVNGFASGTHTATASIVDGAIVVTDGQGGHSRLALSIVSNNEGGGALDFGDFSVLTTGRDREITAGQDAEIRVDGVFHRRASNTVTDVIPGVTLSLATASTDPIVLSVERDVDAIVDQIERFVEAYNGVSEFVASQSTGAGGEGGTRPALSGENILRSMRTGLRNAFESAMASRLTEFGALSELGIAINRRGTYDIDSAVLRGAIENDPVGVQRLFAAYGTTSVSTLKYVSARDAAAPGTYDVVVTTPPAQALVTGSGFGGTYVNDGSPELAIVDSGSEATYAVTLVDGMTLTEIVDALNGEFETATRHQLRSAGGLRADASGTEADVTTTLANLHDAGGANLGVANGDTLTIAGTRRDGSRFFREFTIADVSTQTLGDLRGQIAMAIGTDVVIDVSGGVLTATAVEEGSARFTLTLSSDNAGGGSLDFGGFGIEVEGRARARITASDVNGNLVIRHEDYGSVAGFTVSGGASLGLAGGTYAGTDITGTIGGQAATGAGRVLTGDEGSAAAGLAVLFTGSTGGLIGSVSYSRGIAAEVDRVTNALLSGEVGSIQAIIDGLDTQKKGIDDRIKAFETRIDLRAQNLIKRFSALEEAMAKAQQQLSWLHAQLGSLLAPPGS